MAKKDSLSRTYPIRVKYKAKDLADSSRLIGFQKMTEQAFKELERAIGDIYNTENATSSVLSSSPVYINSLGRSVGSMANLVPPLSGVDQYAPALANRLKDATYNVIPHPDQEVKCEVGCSFDGYDPSDGVDASRKCLKGFDAFYRQQEGSNTTVCQAKQCPGWSGRDGQTIELTDCDPDATSKVYREYKLVMPTEQRNVDSFQVKYYSNCGASTYDRFREDSGDTNFNSVDKTQPENTWAVATTTTASGVAARAQYSYPDLDETSDFIVVVQVPAVQNGQLIEINNVSFGNINGSSLEPRTYLFDLSNLSTGTSLTVNVIPNTTEEGRQALVSQIWIVEKANSPHRNFDEPLLLPKVLEGLSAGTEVPANFVQIFDTELTVNKILDKTRFFAARFEPPSSANKKSNRDSINVRIYDDQKLEVGNDRYLITTVGMNITETLGALMEAFIEHVSDQNIHVPEDRICELLQDRTACCTDSYVVQVAQLVPANRKVTSPGDFYRIYLWAYGGTPPYTIDVDWGDGSNDSEAGIVSGVQSFEIAADRNPAFDSSYEISHQYLTKGTYELSLVVTDDPVNGFGCTSDISSLVSPFNVGSPPEIDLEVRLDNISSYPNYIFDDIEAGYLFGVTEEEDFLSGGNYHIISQIHNTDSEDGKPSIFQWIIDNPNGLTYQFYYENVTAVSGEVLSLTSYSGTLAPSGFIQQDSLVLKRSNGQILEQDVDYTVDWVSGIVACTVGGSVSASENLTAKYFHYDYMSRGDDPSTLSAQQWTTLGSPVNSAEIDLNVEEGTRLTTKQDINTIRFKSKESES